VKIRKLCFGCSHIAICYVEEFEGCPCISCIVKPLCSIICFPRYIYWHKTMGLTIPTDEQYSNLSKTKTNFNWNID